MLQASTNAVKLPSCCCQAVAPLQKQQDWGTRWMAPALASELQRRAGSCPLHATTAAACAAHGLHGAPGSFIHPICLSLCFLPWCALNRWISRLTFRTAGLPEGWAGRLRRAAPLARTPPLAQ